MVVEVLITSCQVSEKWKIGPQIPHTMIIDAAIIKEKGLPVLCVIQVATRLKNWLIFRDPVFC